MAVINRISEQEYRELALEVSRLELWDGEPREKPDISTAHEDISAYLAHLLMSQLDRAEFRVSVNGAKARISRGTYFVPDVTVIPTAWVTPFRDDPRHLAAHAEPLPLVVEVWSRTTGPYDFQRKLTSYRNRGDGEIWYIHLYDRTLTVWRRLQDGSYDESQYVGGLVPVTSLPGVVIDLDDLLDSPAAWSGSDDVPCHGLPHPPHRLPTYPSAVRHPRSLRLGHAFIRSAADACQRPASENASRSLRRAAPGGTPVKRLNARLNAASDP